MPRFTFSKDERLTSLKEIDKLFTEGKSVTSQPLRLIWRPCESVQPASAKVKVMFAVMKKKFPHAVDRNRIKRLMRENYRMLKPELFSKMEEHGHYNVAFLFLGNELPSYDVIQKAMSGALHRWLKTIQVAPRETN